MSEERKQGIQQLVAPTSLKQLRSFLGMVNYFRDFIPNLSVEIGALTNLTATTKHAQFVWDEPAQRAFERAKELVMQAVELTFLEEEGDITLYTDASIVGIGAVLMQADANGVQKPIIYLSHKFSEAASKWSTIEQECYAVYWSILQLQSYLLGRRFSVATDHRNLMYLEKSTVPKLIRWKLRLMEFQFTIKHIAGVSNVIADVLSRAHRLVIIGGEEVESVDILKKIHNDIEGHHGISRTIRKIRELQLVWPGFQKEVKTFIRNCPMCQKIKRTDIPVVHTQQYSLHGKVPMSSISVDSVGPLPEDINGNKHILVIIDNFSKYSMLYATKSTTALEYVQCILQFMGIFGVMKQIRSDGGTQFTAEICKQLAEILKFQHLIILPYHPEANGIVERRNAEVMKHLRALVLERRDGQSWSMYLPLVQRILNSAYDRSIGTYPAQLIFGYQLPIGGPFLAEVIPPENLISLPDFLRKLNQHMAMLVVRSQKYLQQSEREGPVTLSEGHEFKLNDYVMVTYPTRAPTKLSPIYRGPFRIVGQERDDIFMVLDLVTQKSLRFHVDRLRPFHMEENSADPEALEVASWDQEAFVVESIVDHTGSPRTKQKMRFKVRWLGYEEFEDAWLPWREVKDLQALDLYIADHAELKNLL